MFMNSTFCMLTRQQRKKPKKNMKRQATNAAARERARQLLKQRGYSYRRAAPVLGVHYSHLALVLTGKRQSRRLLRRIEQLPPAKQEVA